MAPVTQASARLLALALAPALPLARAGASGAESAAAATPLTKVVEMLDGMLATAKEAKNAEEKEFAAFSKWCEGTRNGYEKSIDDQAGQIVQLTADIDKANADAEELGSAAADELSTADALEKEAASAKAVREKEHADYTSAHADFSESIDAIGRAVVVLRHRSADVPQSLLEVRQALARHLPAEASASIDSLLALKDGQAPQPNAYEFQSGSVIDMLEKLKDKFFDERVALEKAELAAKQNFEVLMQRLTTSIKQAKGTASEKSSAKAQRMEAASLAQGDRSRTETGKAEDEKALSEAKADCEARSEEYEKNQVVRAEEIKAIEKAVEILRSESVAGAAATHLPAASLLQHGRVKTALAQLRGDGAQGPGGIRARASTMLQDKADALGSRYLAVAASHLRSDRFGKVKKLIQDLITKLMEEANAEADQNAFCTTELATNKQTREEKQGDVDKLTAKAEKLTADGQRLSSQLTELSDAVAELEGRRAEATSDRADEKGTNEKTVADAKEAQVAVERAIAVLKEFYGQAGDAGASLLQQRNGGKAAAKTAAKAVQKAKDPYAGMTTESGNVLAFLDVVLSDFARLETETSSSEDQAQASYEKFMAESSQDLAVKRSEIGHKENAKQQTSTTLASVKKELELTHEELDAALTYAEKLKSDCVDTGLSYEDRKAKREEEIQSLKEALRVLDGEDLAA